MAVNVYNSLTKKKEELIPLEGNIVRMYSCGVTVYDKCHIGHARSLYIFDLINRYLKHRGYDVRFVRNITDVDDKIIQKARDTGRTFEEVVTENIGLYCQDLSSLDISPADLEPRATENIGGMIEHIEGLAGKGMAYEVKGDVYFSVRRFEGYGKLSGQSIEKMRECVRIDKDDKKRDPLDFALWKKSKEGEPFWESPWGRGRPGWHIECSVMSLKHLGCSTLDIHAGGRDLIFPHHENEIAQAEALTGQMFAKYWIHHGLLTINGQKMAKSMGNFITVRDAVSEYGADALKMFFLSSHYRSPIDFTGDKLEDAKKNYQSLSRVLSRLAEAAGPGKPPSDDGAINGFRGQFNSYMDDDFNTPAALSVLFDMAGFINKELDAPDKISISVSQAESVIKEIIGILGIKFSPSEPDLTEAQEKLLTERKKAREEKDFKKSDELRDKLAAAGIMVKDTKDGQKWERI